MSPEGMRDLARLRIRQAHETLHDARILLENSGSPRSVINRSYYAAFYAVSALLASEGVSSRKHSGVISSFDQRFVKSGEIAVEFSRSLHELFGMRSEDDYRTFNPVDMRKQHTR